MNANIPYTATARFSNIGELMDMIARKAPLFMRAGGCSCGPEVGRGDPLTQNEKRRITNLMLAGHDLHEIAEAVGRHYTTVARYTRHLRKKA